VVIMMNHFENRVIGACVKNESRQTLRLTIDSKRLICCESHGLNFPINVRYDSFILIHRWLHSNGIYCSLLRNSEAGKRDRTVLGVIARKLEHEQFELQMSCVISSRRRMHRNIGSKSKLSSRTNLENRLKRNFVSVEKFRLVDSGLNNCLNWKTAFKCVQPRKVVENGDGAKYQRQTPATPEYKLLQLRQCLSGEALRTIQNLGKSAASYEAAKTRLERKFGGQRRKIALYLEQLERLKPMQDENPKELEKIADILDIVIVNLKEADRDEELGNGVLYVTLQKKLTEPLLVRYHRWIYENRRIESVLSLRDWMLQEVEFLTTASETIHGCAYRLETRRKKIYHQQTFFGRNNRSKCLDHDHVGSSCTATRTSKCSLEKMIAKVTTALGPTQQESNKPENRKEFIALRTVPVVLKNGNREVTVNALLDDASTQTYINTDVAAELGLHGKFQKATVNVLNGQMETFVTMPVEFELKSLDEFPKIGQKSTVDLLIGVDHADLLYSKQEIRVDDNQAIELYRQLKELYEKADMHPHKWLSNSRAVLEQIPPQERASAVHLDDGQLPYIKTLGLQYQIDVSEQWRHVPSGENPADLISRGINISELRRSEICWLRLKRVRAWINRFMNNLDFADKELRELVKQLDVEKIQVSTANQAAAKRAVYAILSNADITDEELHTAFKTKIRLEQNGPLAGEHEQFELQMSCVISIIFASYHYGTKNVHVAALQLFFNNDDQSFLYGGMVRRGCVDWWINFFKDLRDSGLFYDSDDIQVECLQFCFTSMIRDELRRFAMEWNLHRIRKSVNAESPSGQPDVIYFLSSTTDDARDLITPVSEEDIEIAQQKCCVQTPEHGCSEELVELASIIMIEKHLEMSTNSEYAVIFYSTIVEEIGQIL
ncbi:Hypothetical predicted protein, partial [Paramuricea clavata]